MEQVEKLKITGMSCAACSARVEKQILKMDGVNNANVNLTMEEATINYDVDKLNPADFVKLIEKLGFGAVIMTPDKEEEIEREFEELKLEEAKALKRDLIISIALSLPLFLGMVLSFFGIHNDFVALLHSPWFQLIMATPVQFYVGRRFYKNAWNAVRGGSANMDVLVSIGTTAAYLLSIYNGFIAPSG